MPRPRLIAIDGILAGGPFPSRALVRLLPIVLVAPLLCAAVRVHAQNTVATDKAALVALYNATDGANWTTRTNWATAEPLSSWHGVTTDSDGRVTALALGENGLNGSLPATLTDLSELTTLSLHGNRALTGALPAGLRQLAALQSVTILATELCAPEDDAFQAWLATISYSGLTCPPAAQSVIDAAVFYTPAMRRLVGGKTAIEDAIDVMVATTNTAYRLGGVNQRVAVAAVQETAYTESGTFGTDLQRLAAPDDGYMDEVHDVRDLVAADVVVLLNLDTTITGIASGIMNPASSAFDPYSSPAFATVTGTGGIPFAHELGHLMGLYHDRYVECDGSACAGDSTSMFPYRFGYVNQEGLKPGSAASSRWRTIMAYQDQCSDPGYTCSWLPRFSNPTQTHRGDPLGIAGLEPSRSRTDGPADAVRTLNRTRGYSASFRQAPAITVSFGAAQHTATEGATAATVTVTLSAAPARPIDVPLTVATTGATVLDYSGVPATVRFGASDTERTFTVSAVDDGADDDGEAVTLAFGDPLARGVTRGTRSATTITLVDDDTVTTAPSILGLEETSDPGSDQLYARGDEIEISVRFDKIVTVTGSPRLELTVGSGTRQAAYRDSANEVVRFIYTVTADDEGQVSVAANKLTLGGGAIRDGDNRDASLSHGAVVLAGIQPNRAPEPVGSLPALLLRVPDGARRVSVADAFEDPDGDTLSYGASSSDESVATVSVPGAAVEVTPVAAGETTVTVTAEDGRGSRAEQQFAVTVRNQAPVSVGSLPQLSLEVEDGTTLVDVSGAFRDPEGDELTYQAESSDESVAAVAVFGSAVEVTPLSRGTVLVVVLATDVNGSNTPALQTFRVVVGRPPPPPPPSGPGSGRPGQPNRPPAAVGTLADQALTVGAEPVTVDIAPAFRDPDRDALEYTAESSAEDVAAVSVDGSAVTVRPVGAGTAVVTVTASDGEEGNAPAEQAFTVTVVVDYDADADGLIEVRTLAQLDALRQDLDGDGVPAEGGAEVHAAAFAGAIGGVSCADGCRGYELSADLDFDTNGSGGPDAGDAFWNDGAGWRPIGTEAEPFAAAFEGNGQVIRGLLVAGGAHAGAGLFGATGRSSVVARVGLIAVDVTGTQAAGALAGVNGGRVTACWATGRVAGTGAVGGLAGSNSGDIGGSHAAVAVAGGRQAGGLVGVNDGGLVAVHATGRVSGTEAVGGLVGHHRGTLTASYATGRVEGTDDAGGLVGVVSGPGTVTASYWDTETSGVASGLQPSPAGRGLTTAALQRPTAYGGLYAAWNVDADGDGILDGPWHLGTAAQYPALALDVDGDGRASWPELGRQLRAGPALTAAPAENPAAANLAEVVLAWTAADTSAWTPAPAVSYTVTREAGTTEETVAAGLRGTRYVDAAVQPGSVYTYQVAAVVDGGEAARSGLATAAVPCAYAATPPHRDVLWTAGAGQVAVTTGPGCAWTAASESAFLTVTSGATGTGPGTVRYTVAANAGGPRTGVLAVAGRRVTVYQASPAAFTDHPIERGATPVKAIHLLELRARIDALRAAAGRPAFRWTDPVLTPGATPISRVHLTELRAALAGAYAAAGRAAPVYTDPVVTAGATTIRTAHLMELRAAVAALE